MKLTTRLTHQFIDIKVDKIEDTIFKTDTEEIDRTIENLLEVIEDLKNLKGETND